MAILLHLAQALIFLAEWLWPAYGCYRAALFFARAWALGGGLAVLWRSCSFLELWCVAEAASVALFATRLWRAQRVLDIADRATSPAKRRRVFDNILRSTPDGRAFLSAWFGGASTVEIYEGNAREWTAWSMFHLAEDRMTAAEATELAELVREAGRAWGIAFTPGYNEALRGRSMRLSFDPVRARYRPLVLYLVTWAGRKMGDKLFTKLRFQQSRVNGMAYWHRAPSDNSLPQTGSIVILYGLGVGPAGMAGLAQHLVSKVGRTAHLYVPDPLPYIAYHLFPGPAPMTARAQVKAISAMLRRQQGKDVVRSIEDAASAQHISATFVAQSFGSLTLSSILKQEPDLVDGMLLIDPVSGALQKERETETERQRDRGRETERHTAERQSERDTLLKASFLTSLYFTSLCHSHALPCRRVPELCLLKAPKTGHPFAAVLRGLRGARLYTAAPPLLLARARAVARRHP